MQNNKIKQKTIWHHYRDAMGGKLFVFFLLNAMVFGLAAYLLNVSIPVYYKNIIDAITHGGTYESAVSILWGLIGITTIYYIFDRISEHMDIVLMVRALKKVSMYAAKGPLEHSYNFFTNNFAGSLVNKENKFIRAFDNIVQIILRDFLYAIVVVIGVLFVLFTYSTILGLLSAFWFGLFFWSMYWSTRKRIPYERARGNAQSVKVGVLSDIIANVINLKYFSSKKRELDYFEGYVNKESSANNAAWKMAVWGYTFQGTIVNVAKLTLLFVSIYLWNKGDITSGVIVLVISYSNILFNKLGNIGSVMRRFAENYMDASEFVEVLNTKIDIVDPQRPETCVIKKGEIIFDQVSFGYSDERMVIQDFNLHIKPGEKVGFVGSSGAGKTTITKLLLRFADVSSGEIRIDGQCIDKITQDELRDAISYVPQDTLLFHRSLQENIAYGNPNASLDEVIVASKKAHAHEFIEKLPKKYETLVGERGIKLSGGERQRVAIARAILKDSPILVLDEATSSLDSESEKYIQEGLEELVKGRTTIIIAHRLSTIQKMDRIIVFSEGRIIEDGSHKELLEKRGRYADLWKHQSGGFIQE
ncbi:MAG: hypothetical protein RLY57_263 [Candidatus Parcubacteria bacterium]|jgi:ATP-binding cassette subfamily B protein